MLESITVLARCLVLHWIHDREQAIALTCLAHDKHPSEIFVESIGPNDKVSWYCFPRTQSRVKYFGPWEIQVLHRLILSLRNGGAQNIHFFYTAFPLFRILGPYPISPSVNFQ